MRSPHEWSPRVWVILLAGLALTSRLPFAAQPLGSDEGGFLLVASQWQPGTSLYGDYWVDRPPLLIDFFSLADHLGGAVALRLLGAALVAISVVLAGRIGALAVSRGSGSRWTPVLTAGTAAIYLVNPLFGAMEVNGELIAVPLILLSAERLLRASSASTLWTEASLLVTAGAAAAAAVLVKQNEADALLLIVVIAAGVARRRGVRVAGREVALAATGAIACTVVVLAHALTRGTSLPGLWDAVVTFRLDASAVINSSASPATSARLSHVALSLATSGAPVLIGLLALRLRGHRQAGSLDLRLPALALLAWELISVMAGGSYWLHYLVVLAPGLVLAVAAICATAPSKTAADPAADQRVRRAVPVPLRAALAYATVASLAAIGFLGAHTSTFHGRDSIVEYLSTHKEPGDTAVVAYGHPDILQESGLSSPYPELWSLPVKVRDPGLDRLTSLLSSPAGPVWVVTTGASLAGWGLNSTAAQAALSAHYRYVADVDGHRVFHQLPRLTPTDAPAS